MPLTVSSSWAHGAAIGGKLHLFYAERGRQQADRAWKEILAVSR